MRKITFVFLVICGAALGQHPSVQRDDKQKLDGQPLEQKTTNQQSSVQREEQKLDGQLLEPKTTGQQSSVQRDDNQKLDGQPLEPKTTNQQSSVQREEQKLDGQPLEPKTTGLQPQLQKPQSKPVPAERKLIKPEPKLLDSSQEAANDEDSEEPIDSPQKQQPVRPKPVLVKLLQKSTNQQMASDEAESKHIPKQQKELELQQKGKQPLKKFIPERKPISDQKSDQPQEELKPEPKLPHSLPTLLLPQPIQQKQPAEPIPVLPQPREAKSIESPSSQPRSSPQELVAILRSNSDGPNKDGSYSFDFETSDGQKREEEGRFEDPASLVIRGSYSYTAPDGTFVEVRYVADKNGFQHELLPTPTTSPPPGFPKIRHRVAAPPRNI